MSRGDVEWVQQPDTPTRLVLGVAGFGILGGLSDLTSIDSLGLYAAIGIILVVIVPVFVRSFNILISLAFVALMVFFGYLLITL